MADPIRVSIFFDTQGQPALERSSEGVARLTSRINALAQSADTLPRAIRLAESHINSFGAATSRTANEAIAFLGNRVDALYGSLHRLARIGFATVVTAAFAASLALKSLGRDFLKVNENFANLEISVGSAFESRNIGRQLREQLKQITVTSPIPFQDLAFATRSLSLIPQLNRPVGRQAAEGTLGNEKGFFRQYIQLIEQLLVWRPDKAVDDATFAIREAATGELRSLIRRFDFPAQLLVNASGKSIEELKRDPQAMVASIKTALDKVISPQAIRQIALQPTRLFENIKEQLKDIPLLEVGDAGLYEKILRSLENFFNRATKFISTSFAPYAKRISDSFSNVFDSFIDAASRSVSGVAKILGVSTPSLVGLTSLEKGAEIVASASEIFAEKAPKLFERVANVAEKVAPLFTAIIEGLTRVMTYLATLFERSPLQTGLAVFLTTQLPHMFRFISKSIADFAVKSFQQARLDMLAPILQSGNGTANLSSNFINNGLAAFATGNNATVYRRTPGNSVQYYQNVAAIQRGGGVLDPNNPGNYTVPVPNALRFAGVRGSTLSVSPVSGFENAIAAAYFNRRGFGLNPIQGTSVQLPTALDDRRSRRLLSDLGLTVDSAGRPRYLPSNPYGKQPGYAPRAMVPVEVNERLALAQEYALTRATAPTVASRWGAGVSGAALGAGLSTGVAGAAGAAVSGVTAIASSVILPILATVAASYLIYTITDKVKDYIDSKGVQAKQAFVKREGLSEDSLSFSVRQLESSQNYFAGLKKNDTFRQANISLARVGLAPLQLSQEAISSLSPTRRAQVLESNANRPIVPAVEKFSVSIDKASIYLDALRDDVDNLGRQFLDFGTGDFKSFSLKSNPDIKVQSDNAASIFSLLKKSADETEKAVSLLSNSLKGTVGGREQVLSPSQASVFSRLEDYQATFGPEGKGIFPMLTGETQTKFDESTKKNVQVPTAFSMLAARLGASRESEEAARLTSDASATLRALAVKDNPFVEYAKVFSEDAKRIEELYALRSEIGKQDFTIGTDTVARLENIVKEAKDKKIDFDYSSIESAISDLKKGFGSNLVQGVLKEFDDRINSALVSGLGNRTTQFLSVFATTAEDLFSSKDTASFDRLTSNLNKQFEAFVGQLEKRGVGVTNLPSYVDQFTELTGQLQSEASVPEDLVITTRNANARIASRVMGVVDELLQAVDEGLVKKGQGLDASALLIQDERASLRRFIENYTKRVITASDEILQKLTESTNQSLSDNVLSGNFSANTRGQRRLLSAQVAAANSDARFDIAGARRPDFDIARLSGATEGTAGFTGRITATREVLRVNESIISQLEPKIVSMTDAYGKLTIKTDADRVALEKFEKAATNASEAVNRLNNEMNSSPQRESFMQLLAPLEIRNGYDEQILSRRRTQANAFAEQFGGEVPTFARRTTEGPQQTTNQLKQYADIERAASRNAVAFSSMADSLQEAGQFTSADAYKHLSDTMLELAANARSASEAIKGRGGIVGSFTDGFTSLTNRWRETAQNFSDIGRNLASSLSDGLGTALTNFALSTESASEAFANFGKSMLNTITQVFMQKSVQTLLGFALGGFGQVGTIAAGSVAGAVPVTHSGMFDDGGQIPGVYQGRDNLIASVASEEYIIPAKTVRKFGVSHFDYYRKGEMPPAVASMTKKAGGSFAQRAFYAGAFNAGGVVNRVHNSTVNNSIVKYVGGFNSGGVINNTRSSAMFHSVAHHVGEFNKGGVVRSVERMMPSYAGAFDSGGVISRNAAVPVMAAPVQNFAQNTSNSSSVVSAPISVSVTINDKGTPESKVNAEGDAKQLGRVIQAAVESALVRSVQQGGIFSNANKNRRK